MDPSGLRPPPHHSLPDRLRAWIEWFGLGRLVAAACSVALVAGGAVWLLHAPPPSTEATLPYAGATSVRAVAPSTTGAPSTSASTSAASGGPGASPAETTPTDLVVHVAGAVTRPGVVHVPAGARVIDAVVAAGGALPEADGNVINLAAVLRDGARVYVPRVGEPLPAVVGTPTGAVGGSAGTAVPAGPLDLNTATAMQLDALAGVGPSTAAAIVAFREQHGPFQSVDELTEVRGIGPAKLEALRTEVTV